MLPKKLQAFLEKQKIAYEALTHKTVYTAFDAAQTLKIKLSEIAKVVITHIEPSIKFGAGTKDYVMLVLPAHLRVDFAKVKKLLKVKKVVIVKEEIMARVLKVKAGAITPFALLYNVPVFLDKTILKTKSVIANAGTHTDSLKVKVSDLIKAGGKVIGSFGERKAR